MSRDQEKPTRRGGTVSLLRFHCEGCPASVWIEVPDDDRFVICQQCGQVMEFTMDGTRRDEDELLASKKLQAAVREVARQLVEAAKQEAGG